MARIAGRQARLYLGVSSGAEASPIGDTRSWDLNSERDQLDASCQGDTSKVTLVGLPGGSGSFSGIWNDSVASSHFAAALEGTSRKLYGYPSTGDLTKYFFTSALLSASLSAAHDGLVEVSGTWSSDSGVTWQGV